MKKLLFLITVFIFAGTTLFAQNYIEDDEDIDWLYDKVEQMVVQDFSGSSLTYKSFDEVHGLALELPLEDRQAMYEEHCRSVALYRGLNMLLPGIGSLAQGDVYGGMSALITYTLSGCILMTGVYTWGFSGYFYLWYAIFSGLSNSEIKDIESFPAYQFGIGATLVGLGMLAANYIYAFMRPAKFSTGFNKELASVLGVTDVDVSLAPCVSPDLKTGAVSLGLAIKF